MFKRKPKHVFTCPDVIFLQKQAKKNQKIALAINLIIIAGFWTVGHVAGKAIDEQTLELPNPETPTDN